MSSLLSPRIEPEKGTARDLAGDSERIRWEQINAHYESLTAFAVGPALGAILVVNVLWSVVDRRLLVPGYTLILLVSAYRVFLRSAYLKADEEERRERHWEWLALATSFVTGAAWGISAMMIFPLVDRSHDAFLLTVFTLVPLLPLGSAGMHVPSFYAYSLPASLPFVGLLVTHDHYGHVLAGLTLATIMLVAVALARRTQKQFDAAIRLRMRIEEQRDEVEAAVAAKTRFLAAASHDIRQPLHALGLLVGSLRRSAESERARELAEQAERATDALRSLMDELLDISRLDAGVVEAHPKHFELDGFIAALMAEFVPRALEKGLRIDYEPSDLVIESDPILLSRLIRNLLDNAVKYTDRGSVEVRVRRSNGRVRIEIADTGSGISEEQQQLIFEEFVQLQNPGRDRTKGLGLGLAIVTRLAALLETTIALDSSEGGGSVFAFDQPLGDEALVDVQREMDVPSGGAGIEGRRILLVDDNSNVLEAMERVLSDWGCHVETAFSGQQAEKALGQADAPFDLLISDLCLADGESGLDVVRRMRDLSSETLPALMITGDTVPDHIREVTAMELPLLHKPVRPAKLRAIVTHLLDGGASESEGTPPAPPRGG